MSFVKPLIGVSGNRAGREDTVLAFQAFRQRWPRLKAVVSQGAERLFHGSRRPFAGFSLTLGDYIIPYIIGSSRFFIGQVVFLQQGTAGNIPLAAAFSVVPIAIMAVYLAIAKRLGAFDAL